MIRVLISGAAGRMGQETVKAVTGDAELMLVGQTQKTDSLAEAIQKNRPDVVVDFTEPSSVYANAQTIIASGARPVIGTTGLTAEHIHALQTICTEKKLGGIIAPNFSIGAVLMMRYAREAARYFSRVEIIEMHHDRKVDSPSGTAIRTAEMIAETQKTPPPLPSRETVPGARGAICHHVPIHAIRLPGVVASQEVIFGDQGETFSIRHHTIHRESFMPGVLLACKKVMELDKLLYGMEHLL